MNRQQLLERDGLPAEPSFVPGPAGSDRLVSAWMSAPATSVTALTPIPDAYDLSVQRQIHHLPVVAGDRVVGLVTRAALREVLPFPARMHGDPLLQASMRQLGVGLVMDVDPPTVTSRTTVRDAARLMLTHGLAAVPVVGPAGDLLGILTASDLCRLIAAETPA